MITEKAYIVGVGLNNFRTGTPAEIIGVQIVKPGSSNVVLPFRPCYHAEWSDGVRDYIPISSVERGDHKIITFAEVINKSWETKKEDEEKWVKLKCEICGQEYTLRNKNRMETCMNVITHHPKIKTCDGKLIEI